MKTLNYCVACMIVLLAIAFMSCEKEHLVDQHIITEDVAMEKLTLDDLVVGETYSFDQLDQSVLEILEIDVNVRKRAIYYKILHYNNFANNDTRIEIDYPGGYVHDLNGSWLLWQKNPSINGTYVYSWHGDSSDTQQLRIKKYIVSNGNLDVVSDYTVGPVFNSLNGASGEVDFWDGGWQFGSMN